MDQQEIYSLLESRREPEEDMKEFGEAAACGGREPYALMVLGDSMEPEFNEGDIIVIEPDGNVTDGSYIIAYQNDEYIFRQLRIDGKEWFLQALKSGYEREPISGPEVIKGVITQKKPPRGGRSTIKSYV